VLLRIDNQLADNLYDEISGIVLTMATKKTWNANCAVLFERLDKILSKKKYKTFSGDCRTYHLTRKGQSCLYDVPSNQLGYLIPYRNQRVRLVCLGGWNAYSDRIFSVAVVPKRIHENVVLLHRTESNQYSNSLTIHASISHVG